MCSNISNVLVAGSAGSSTLFSSAKPELFLANVKQTKGLARSGGLRVQSGSLGRDYTLQFQHSQEKEMSSREKSDEEIFHPSKQTINND